MMGPRRPFPADGPLARVALLAACTGAAAAPDAIPAPSLTPADGVAIVAVDPSAAPAVEPRAAGLTHAAT